VKVTSAFNRERAIVRLAGRLDGEWAEHLSDTLGEMLRRGARTVLVEMQGVTYISSAALKVLVRHAADFAALRGELTVMTPSPAARDTLTRAGLGELIFPASDRNTQPIAISKELERRGQYTQEWRFSESPAGRPVFELSPHTNEGSLTCLVHGDPATVERGGIQPADCTTLECTDDVIAVGVGAIGSDFAECREQMGELIAGAGAVAYLPTEGSAVPDYLLTLGGRAPSAVLADGISCRGSFAHLARFQLPRGQDPVTLSELATNALDVNTADSAGFAMVAEVSALVGAWRRRSPAAASGLHFDCPAIRDDLSFTTERVHQGTTALVVGVVARRPSPPLSAQLRPIAPGSEIQAHFHAVVFSYAPVPLRTVSPLTMVPALFANQSVRGILHLLADDRGAAGVGESEFLRGLVWSSPIVNVGVAVGAGV